MPTEDRVRQTLRRRADASSLPDELWDRIEAGRGRGQAGRARRIAVAVFSLALATVTFVYLVMAFRQDPPTQPVDEISYGVQEFPLDSDVGRLIVAEGSIWIASDGEVIRVDPSTGDVLAEIPVRLEEPGSYPARGQVAPGSGLTLGDGLIWVTAEPFFAGIDPATDQIATSIAWESGVTEIAWADGRLLYGGSGEGIAEARLLDPYLGKLEQIHLPTAANPLVLATEHWFWAGGRPLNSEQLALTRASRDGRLSQEVTGIHAVDSMVEVGGSLWVTGDQRLWQVDVNQDASQPTYSEVNAVIKETRLDGPGKVAAGGGRLWLVVSSSSPGPGAETGSLMELDLRTGEVIGSPITLPYAGRVELAIDPDGLPWLTIQGNQALFRVRPADEVTEVPEETVAQPRSFVPQTRPEGDRLILPVTFPDGSTAELLYPPDLDIAGLGVTPYMAGCGHDFGFTYFDPRGTMYKGAPLETYIGSDGNQVSLYESVPGFEGIDFLMFSFGEWWVDLYQYSDERDTPGERRFCAEHLLGTVTEDGWLVLSGPESLDLYRPKLQFGDLGPERRFLILFAKQCESDPDYGTVEIDGIRVDLSEDFASWCDPSGVDIHVYFDPDSSFFEDVIEGLEIRNYRPAA
jgi:hypothetical protein